MRLKCTAHKSSCKGELCQACAEEQSLGARAVAHAHLTFYRLLTATVLLTCSRDRTLWGQVLVHAFGIDFVRSRLLISHFGSLVFGKWNIYINIYYTVGLCRKHAGVPKCSKGRRAVSPVTLVRSWQNMAKCIFSSQFLKGWIQC